MMLAPSIWLLRTWEMKRGAYTGTSHKVDFKPMLGVLQKLLFPGVKVKSGCEANYSFARNYLLSS